MSASDGASGVETSGDGTTMVTQKAGAAGMSPTEMKHGIDLDRAAIEAVSNLKRHSKKKTSDEITQVATISNHGEKNDRWQYRPGDREAGISGSPLWCGARCPWRATAAADVYRFAFRCRSQPGA
jgi:hypothetical protein